MPDKPPITNIDTNPSAHNIGVQNRILPSHSVANQEKTLIPVGMAISSVVIIIGTRSHGAIPETNMWCAHTLKPSTRIAITTSSDVVKFAHTRSGMRQNVIPGARMVMIVTRKLSAVMIDDAPAH